MKSNKSDYLLTFELDSKNEVLEIHANQHGLEKLKTIIDLDLNRTELTFLINALDEVLKQIDEWESQTRIGVNVLEVIKIRQKFTNNYI